MSRKIYFERGFNQELQHEPEDGFGPARIMTPGWSGAIAIRPAYASVKRSLARGVYILDSYPSNNKERTIPITPSSFW